MTPLKIEPGSRAVHVRRGNIGLVLPITRRAFDTTPAGEIAGLVAGAMFMEQGRARGRADEPIPTDDTQLALRLVGRDNLLDPDLPLRDQTAGAWRTETLPMEAQGAATARLPVAEFELVDVPRPAIYLV